MQQGTQALSTAATAEPQDEQRLPSAEASARLFGVEVANIGMAAALDWIVQRTKHKQQTLLNFVNAHCFNVACANDAYHRVLKRSTRLFPDGSGVKLALGLQGVALEDNLNGTDLFPLLCQRAQAEDLSLYLLGAGPGVAERVAQNMCQCFPGLRIAGCRDGFFSEQETAQVIEEINRSGAHILLVAMGVPMQELWLDKHLHRLRSTVNMGVGGLFDFYSGRISRAPGWLRAIGMEWTWRLLQEPGRMWRRYLIGNPVFVLRAWLDVNRMQRQRRSFGQLTQRQGKALTRQLSWWLSTRATPIAKRGLDIVASGTALLLAGPLLGLTALAIRLESAGPIFFSQQRVGLNGEEFQFWKFRSMYTDAEERKQALLAQNEMAGGVLFKMKKDPRITRVGRFIRRFSIDELPQLWNVLRGDMSLVGPRPALPREVAQYSLRDRHRLAALPGITCIWQVSGRSDIPFEQQVEMDRAYIHKATLGMDIRLLMKTVPAVISGRGAY